jgi:hypothetical protein
MPPLHYHLDDKENSVWRNAFPRDNSSDIICPQNLSNASGFVRVPCRRAHFGDKIEVQVFTIGSRDDYSQEETESRWYSASEYAAFRRDLSTTVYLLKTDPGKIDDAKYTMRGAESNTLDGCNRRSYLRSIARTAVLDEQACQKSLGINDDSRLAQAYTAVAQQALYSAFNAAAVDQSGAQRYQTESTFHDLFNDSWIRSVSAVSSGSSSSVRLCRESSFGHDEKCFGFDDSWLSDVSSSTR